MSDQTSVPNAFTVDLEEWFQGLTSTNPQVQRWAQLESRVEHATSLLLDILQQQEVQATFFVLGHVAAHHPDLIARIHAQGHEIGVHGYYHSFVHRLTPDAFAAEIERTVTLLVAITREHPWGHRAPYFSLNGRTPWALDVLETQDFRYDSSFFPVRTTLYGDSAVPRFPHRLPDHSLYEFPLATARLAGMNWPIAGGFYLRALPYRLIRDGIRQLNRQGQPAILYHHPWELDVEQPIITVTPRERVTHYFGRRGLAAKLRRLFQDFSFVPLRTLLAEMALRDKETTGLTPGLVL